MSCPACGAALPDDQADCPHCQSSRPACLELPDGTRLLLEKETVTLGRGSGNDHILADTSISRRHARLRRLPHGWLLIDLGSSNGTCVNGDRVRVPYLLQDGDELLLGEQRAVFRAGSAAPVRDAHRPARANTVLGRSAFGMPPAGGPTGEPAGDDSSTS